MRQSGYRSPTAPLWGSSPSHVDSMGIEPTTQILQVSNATLEHGRPWTRNRIGCAVRVVGSPMYNGSPFPHSLSATHALGAVGCITVARPPANSQAEHGYCTCGSYGSRTRFGELRNDASPHGHDPCSTHTPGNDLAITGSRPLPRLRFTPPAFVNKATNPSLHGMCVLRYQHTASSHSLAGN